VDAVTIPLPHTVTLTPPEPADDPYAGTSAGTPVEPRTIAAWVQQRSTRDQLAADRAALVTDVMMISLVEPDPAETVAWDGRTYLIQGRPAGRSTPAGVHHWETVLREVDG
jgi:hypothetical protein